MEAVGTERRWLAVALRAALGRAADRVGSLVSAHLALGARGRAAREPGAHAAVRRDRPASGHDRAAVYRVGPQGSRFVNAVALPSVRRPSVAMGNALLELLDADETAAIFAHEVAHFDHFTPRRVRRSQLINRALIVTGVALPLLRGAGAMCGWAPWIGWLWPIVVLVARRPSRGEEPAARDGERPACGGVMRRSRSAGARAREAASARADPAAVRRGHRAGGVASEPGPSHPGHSCRRRGGGRAAWRRDRHSLGARGQLGRSRGHALVLAGRRAGRHRCTAGGAARGVVELPCGELP